MHIFLVFLIQKKKDFFKKKLTQLKKNQQYSYKIKKNLKKEIEKMINEYIILELSILPHSSDKLTKINIEGNVKHYLEFFLYYK